MQNTTEYSESADRFTLYMRQRLENHCLPVDPQGWRAVESGLKRRRTVRISRIAATAAVAVTAGLLWLITPYNTPDTPHETLAEQTAGQPTAQTAQQPLPAFPEQANRRTARQTPPPAVNGATPLRKEPFAQEEPVPAPLPETAGATENAKAEKVTDDRKETATAGQLPAPAQRQAGKPEQKIKENRWLLAAGIGSGGSVSSPAGGWRDAVYENAPSFSDVKNGSLSNPGIPHPEEMPGALSPEDYSDISYALPLSFGITARKPVAGNWDIETGLTYTYLSTSFSNSKAGNVRGKLGLHYLGVPVNLVGYFHKGADWDIYASAGVMLEQGLRAVYAQSIHHTQGITTTTGKTSIHGLQWSLNGAIGVSFRIHDHWRLYAEPKVYYYFNSNQPISMRTEHPLGVGIGAGVRYRF